MAHAFSKVLDNLKSEAITKVRCPGQTCHHVQLMTVR